MARRARLRARSGAGLRRQALEDLYRVSAAPEARKLLARSGPGKVARGRRQPELEPTLKHRQGPHPFHFGCGWQTLRMAKTPYVLTRAIRAALVCFRGPGGAQ